MNESSEMRFSQSRVRCAEGASAVLLVIVAACSLVGVMRGCADLADLAGMALKAVFAAMLLFGAAHRSPRALKAGSCGLLAALLFAQADYVFGTLLIRNPSDFVVAGFLGSFYLATEVIALVLLAICLLNCVGRIVRERDDAVRNAVNRASVILLFAALIIQEVIYLCGSWDGGAVIYYGLFNLVTVIAAFTALCGASVLRSGRGLHAVDAKARQKCAAEDGGRARGATDAGVPSGVGQRSFARLAVWCEVAFVVSIFSICILTCIQGSSAGKLLVVAVALALVEVGGFAFCLCGRAGNAPARKPRTGRLRLFAFRLVRVICTLAALAIVLVLGFATVTLYAEYHCPLEATSNIAAGAGGTGDVSAGKALSSAGDVEVVEIEGTHLYVLYPRYSSVEFAVGERPSEDDESIILCTAGAFQKTYNLSFEPGEICGTYVVAGQLHEGYAPNGSGYGAFAFYDGGFHFANEDQAHGLLDQAAARGGYGFQQLVAIDEGKSTGTLCGKCRCFRVLGNLGGKLCIIDSMGQMDYDEFIAELVDLGVTQALYLDMGAFWNYSWYRDAQGQAQRIIGLPWPFSHNWLVFKK